MDLFEPFATLLLQLVQRTNFKEKTLPEAIKKSFGLPHLFFPVILSILTRREDIVGKQRTATPETSGENVFELQKAGDPLDIEYYL